MPETDESGFLKGKGRTRKESSSSFAHFGAGGEPESLKESASEIIQERGVSLLGSGGIPRLKGHIAITTSDLSKTIASLLKSDKSPLKPLLYCLQMARVEVLRDVLQKTLEGLNSQAKSEKSRSAILGITPEEEQGTVTQHLDKDNEKKSPSSEVSYHAYWNKIQTGEITLLNAQQTRTETKKLRKSIKALRDLAKTFYA